MRNYEVTFIVDPLLPSDEIKGAAKNYRDHIESEGSSIVAVDEMGLKQLAYPIQKRNSGVYFSVEFASETGSLIPKLELALSRDSRILRFLTIAMDKHAVKFNEDKRNGLIGKKREEEEAPSDTVTASSDQEPDPSDKKSNESE